MRKKKLVDFSRKPKVAKPKADTGFSSLAYETFSVYQGRKISAIRPQAYEMRNWSRHNPIVRRCINLIKDRIIAMPYQVTPMKPTAQGKKHALIWENILSNPNNNDTYYDFMNKVLEDLIVGDCGCFEVAQSSNKDKPVSLFPIDGFTICYVWKDGKQSFAQSLLNKSNRTNEYIYFEPDEIVYLSKHQFTNMPYGLSPMESAFKQIDTFTNTFDYSRVVASNSLPKYAMWLKNIGKDVLDTYRAYFQQECMGTGNLPILGGEDVKAVQISPISEEATYMQYQQFVMSIIAFCFGVPSEKLAIAKSNDRSTISEINDNLMQDAVKPYCMTLINGINKLISRSSINDVTFDLPNTFDTKTITDLYLNGLITLNEARVKLGYSELPNGNTVLHEQSNESSLSNIRE